MSNPADLPPAEPARPVEGDPAVAADVPEPPETASGSTDVSVPRRADRRLVFLLVLIGVVVTAVDQLSKAWVQSSLADGHTVQIIGDALRLQLVYNPGAALSIGTGMTWLLTIVVVVVVVLIIRATRRLGSTGWAIALGLLLGGAIGNLIDRLFRAPGFARGRVVDFIGYGHFFVGNIADIAIVGAAILIALLALWGIGMDGSRAKVEAADDAGVHDDSRSEG